MKNGVVSSEYNDISFLRERFQAIFTNADNSGDIEAFFNEVKTHYEAPSRHHHNLQHILEIIKYIDERKDSITNWQAVQLAIYLHDVIYDVTCIEPGKNEQDCIDFSSRKLPILGVTSDIIHRVNLHIGDTKTHTPTAELGGDGELFLDGDLSVLGESPERYREYSDAIRKEFSWVPEGIYNNERAKIMGGFLTREKIFFRDRAREALARKNISQEIQTLKQ